MDFQPHPGVLDLHHVADICAGDWGLCIDVMNNIDTVVEHVGDYDLGPRDAARVRRTLELAQDMMSEQAKTLRWRLRSRIGKRVRWYSEVEGQFGGRAEDMSLARAHEGGPGRRLTRVRARAGPPLRPRRSRGRPCPPTTRPHTAGEPRP